MQQYFRCNGMLYLYKEIAGYAGRGASTWTARCMQA
jgi:hypothetical protein